MNYVLVKSHVIWVLLMYPYHIKLLPCKNMSHELIQVKRFFNQLNIDFLLACTDAYLTPCLKRYIDTFSNAFEKNKLNELNVLFMQSDGGLTPVEK
jgi:hypothetical protein